MKRIAEWFAAVGAAAGRKGKRLVAIVAAVAMLGGVAGVSATAMADDGNASTTQSQTTDEKAAASAPAPLSTEGTNGVPDDPTLSAPAREKTVTANEDGTYTVALNVTGAKSAGTGEIVTNQPLDIVLVLDVSGSMAEKIASGWNQPTKIDSLKTAVNKFINATAAENAKITDQSQRNRIALVKFAGTEKTSVGNDFYREGWSSYNYTQIVSNLTYDVSGLTSTVNGLSASGATSADYAFNRAQAALTYQPRANAKKVVIFFTDGEPNHGSGFDPTVAATAVNKAKSLKDAGTTIYSIGVVSGANPGDTSSNLNKYMHGISSNYPDATATSSEHLWGKSWNANLGDRAETSSYYKAATDAGQLNNIFESIYQEITKTAEYADVTIHDRLSSWVVSSDSASENGEPAGFTYTKTRKGQTTAWADAPEATVAADGTVSWPVMSNDDTLEDGVTYTVSFNVKPTQAAFDEAVKNHKDDANASGDNNFYTNDNSSATVDYKTVVTSSQGGTTTSDPQTAAYLQKPTITLPVSKITVTKTWSDGNANHENDSVQVQLKQDGNNYGDAATLNAAGNWTHEFTVPAGPEGHKYTVEETAVDGYDASYELAVIKDTTTSSVVAENDVKKLNLIGLTEQDGTVTITNKPSYVTLPASNLQVTKEVLGRGASADFTFNLKCEDNGDAKCENVEGLTSNGLTATVKQNQLTTSGKTATANFGDSALKFRVPTGNATQLVYKFNVTEDRTNVPAGWRYDGSTKTVTVTIAKNDDGQWAATVNDNNPTFTNKYVAISSLPLTGGTTGRDWMVFGGGVGLMALLAAAGYTVWRKRQLV
ncbi:fimbriae protein with LPXTG motif and von Willebrand factor typeA domain [Bifidobacterium longum subsp. longum]|nr:VWA domain-containing protein [Bifidobacterium longum]TCF48235.1 fimbriae protein with LPXTG motif and von Willebrand factor typeA domain [Bifidobacterium longum subsp. longum]